MGALNRKLFRDLWRIKGQGLAISAVIGVGVLMFIMYLSTFHSLQLTRSTYYERQRFAHVFASLKRAPLSLHNRIASIPGVSQAETRVVVDVTLDIATFFRPEDVLVTDRVDGGTQLTRLDAADLQEWLQDYSLGQLWEKNHFGGRPGRSGAERQ